MNHTLQEAKHRRMWYSNFRVPWRWMNPP